jgi:hypothetical protein
MFYVSIILYVIIIDYKVKNNIIGLYKKPYEIITNIKNSIYKKSYEIITNNIIGLYKKSNEIITNIKNSLYNKSNEIITNIKNSLCKKLYKIINYFKRFNIIIKKSYELILVFILSEIIDDFKDLYESNYIFNLYNIFKIIIIIKKSYEIIKIINNILSEYIKL